MTRFSFGFLAQKLIAVSLVVVQALFRALKGLPTSHRKMLRNR